MEAYTIAANLRWFAVADLIASAAVIGFSVALGAASIDLPSGASTGANVGAFLAAVGMAGQRFAAKTDNAWTRDDRRTLAMGYVGVALAISIALVAIFLAGMAALGVDASEALGGLPVDAMSVFAVILVIALIAVALLYYAGARFVLGSIAKRAGAPV